MSHGWQYSDCPAARLFRLRQIIARIHSGAVQPTPKTLEFRVSSSALGYAVRHVEFTLNIVWIGSALFILGCAGAVWVTADPLEATSSLFLSTLFGALSVSLAMASAVLFTSSRSMARLHDALSGPPIGLAESLERALPHSLHPEEAQIVGVLRAAQARMFGSWMMVDTIAIAGTYLGYVTHSWSSAFPFFVSSAVLILLMKPRLGPLAERLSTANKTDSPQSAAP